MLRSATSVQTKNVGSLERMACITAGALLFKRLFRSRSIPHIVGAAVGTDLVWRGVTGQCVFYRALGVNTANKIKPTAYDLRDTAPRVQRSITVGKSPDELYAFWRNPENLPQIMAHFAEVTPKSDGLSHRHMRGPMKQFLYWDCKQIEEQPGRKLSWHTMPEAEIPNHGSVTFRPAPDGSGTEVTLEMQFEPPLGVVGDRLAKTLRKIPRAVVGQALPDGVRRTWFEGCLPPVLLLPRVAQCSTPLVPMYTTFDLLPR